MKKNGLLLVLIILCIAAWTAAENALTDLFDKEGSVKALFVSEKEYEQAIKNAKFHTTAERIRYIFQCLSKQRDGRETLL